MLEIFIGHIIGCILSLAILYLSNKLMKTTIDFDDAVKISIFSWGAVVLTIVLALSALIDATIQYLVTSLGKQRTFDKLADKYYTFCQKQNLWFR